MKIIIAVIVWFISMAITHFFHDRRHIATLMDEYGVSREKAEEIYDKGQREWSHINCFLFWFWIAFETTLLVGWICWCIWHK